MPRSSTAEQAGQLCGFKDGMRVLIFDPDGGWDPITITQVQDPALHLQHDGKLKVVRRRQAVLTQLSTHTYYLKTDWRRKLTS